MSGKRDSNPRPPPWQGGALANWAIPASSLFYQRRCQAEESNLNFVFFRHAPWPPWLAWHAYYYINDCMRKYTVLGRRRNTALVTQASPVYDTGVDAETRLLDYNIFWECWAGGEMVDAQRSGRCEATHGGSSPPPPTKNIAPLWCNIFWLGDLEQSERVS